MCWLCFLVLFFSHFILSSLPEKAYEISVNICILQIKDLRLREDSVQVKQ